MSSLPNYYQVLDGPDTMMDSGASRNLAREDTPPVNRKTVSPIDAKHMVSVSKNVCCSVATDKFPLPLSAQQRRTDVFSKNDLHMNLLSTGKICEDGTLKVVFDDKHCDIIERKSGRLVYRGYYNPDTRLFLNSVNWMT